MPRTTKSGKELTFHKSTKRWCKYYQDENGKRKTAYFGSGTNVRDTRSYMEALKRYHPWQQEREAKRKRIELEATEAAILEGKQPVADLGNSPYALDKVADWKLKGLVTKEGYYNLRMADPDKRDPDNDADWEEDGDTTWMADDPAEARREAMAQEQHKRGAFAQRVAKKTQKPKRNRKKTINQIIDAWLADERRNKPSLQESSHIDKRDGIGTFRTYLAINGTKYFGKSEAVDELLMNYRTWLIDQMDDPTSKINKPNTVNDKTKFGGQLIRWAHKVRELKELPRRLEDFTANLPVIKGGKPLLITDIHKIWAKANPRWRCFMLIGLNCGMKNSEIAGLLGKDLQGKRLMGIRAKTKEDRVLFNFALWPSTLKAIRASRDNQGDNELLFINRTGGEITTQSFSSSFKKICKQAGDPEATFERLKDTSVKLVKTAIHKQGLHRSYSSLFQMHRDAGTNEFYDDNTDPEHLRVPKLDKIVMELEKTYGLKLDASSPKATVKKKAPPKTKAKIPKPPKAPSHPELAHLRK